MGVHIQQVIFYEKKGDLTTKKIVVPKIINTDISFQLQFGFTMPKKTRRSSDSTLKSYPDVSNL